MIEFALELARRAEADILPRFRNTDVFTKADGTVVTEADRAAERLMRALIAEEFPDDAILGEEYGAQAGTSGRRWILDPIDGTAAFTLGLPTFGTLIALEEEGEARLGVIHLPALGETVYAARGMGCWHRNDQGQAHEIRVDASAAALRDAYVSSTGVYRTHIQPLKADDPMDLGAVIRRAARFRFVGDCVQHALVARGVIHAAIDTEMHPWDNAAIIPCVLEAGGAVASTRGKTDNLVDAPDLVTASSPALLQEIVATLYNEESR
ncbi:MAG: inositol phosphatase [Bacteroidetes bacterium CG12_big_fil_rev_8_21_14_0_65_60_17]|nr:MAG: inositol phosphatase [Bacteroidetes bacterium CG12_big_fil_rev_8_21_14_0_65_60_17]